MSLDGVENLPESISFGEEGHNDDHMVVHKALKDVKNELDGRLSEAGLSGTYVRNANRITPDANETSIRAAALELKNSGGGTVLLPASPPEGIRLTSELPTYAGVWYEGVQPVLVQPNVTTGIWMGDAEFDFAGGTWFVGDGTFPAFSGNTTPLESVPGDIGNTQISNWGIEKVGVKNFTTGLGIGAKNTMGMVYGRIDKFYARDCSEWGVNLVNFQHVSIGEIYTCLCQNGQRFAVSLPGLTLYPGNLEIGEIFTLIPRDGRDNRKCRGIVFEVEGLNAALNEVLVRRAQVNGFNRSLLAVSAGITSGSTSVTVPDGSLFSPGMVVNFTSTNYGYTLGQAYLVKTVVGNTLTIANSKAGAAISGTGTGSLTIQTRGFPNMEIGTVAGEGYLSNSQFFQLDTEGTASCGVYIENATGCTFGLADLPATIVAAHIVGRQMKFSKVESQNAAVTDFDANSTTSSYFGTRSTAYQRPLRGVWSDINSSSGVNFGAGTNNQGATPDIHTRQGGFLYPRAGMGTQVWTRDSAVTLGGANVGKVIFAGSSAVTYTLPTILTDASAIGASQIGAQFDICNVGSGTLTVSTDGTQVFNKVAAKTSVTVLPGNSLVVTAAKDASGNLFWLAKASALVS